MVYIKSNPKQTLLLPTNLRDIIPKDHICYLTSEGFLLTTQFKVQ